MADAVRTVTYKLLVDGGEVQKTIADIDGALTKLNKGLDALNKPRPGGGPLGGGGTGGGGSSGGGKKNEYGFDAFDQKVANDTHQLRMKLWREGQAAKKRAEDAARREAAETARQEQKESNDTFKLRMKLWNDQKKAKEDAEKAAAKAAADAARQEQKEANDTYRLKMKLWRDEQKEKRRQEKEQQQEANRQARRDARTLRDSDSGYESDLASAMSSNRRDTARREQAERDSARARAEAEAANRRRTLLEENLTDRRLNVAQKGLGAFSGLARSAGLLSGMGGESMEDMVRAFANLEGMLQGAHGILDSIEMVAAFQKAWRVEAELTAAAMKGTAAVSAISSAAGGAAAATGGGGASAASGAGMLGGLSMASMSGLLPIIAAGGLIAMLPGLGMQTDFRARDYARARGKFSARQDAESFGLESAFDRASRAGVDPLALAKAQGATYGGRVGSSVSQRLMSAQYDDITGVVHNRSQSEKDSLNEEWRKLTTAHYQAEVDNLNKLKAAKDKQYDEEMKRIDEARHRAVELISTLQGAYEGAVHRRQGIEERIATGDPGAIALARRGMMKADAGEELSAREASAIRGFSPKYDAIAQQAFSRIARKKLPGALSDVDSEIEFFREARGGAIGEAAKFDRNRIVEVKLGDGTPIEVKMSVDEESVHRTLEPFIRELEFKIKKGMQVLADELRSEAERDRGTRQAAR